MKDDAIHPDTKFVVWHVGHFRKVGCDGMFLIRLGRSMCNNKELQSSLLSESHCCRRNVGWLCSVPMVVLLMVLLTSCCFDGASSFCRSKCRIYWEELVFVFAAEGEENLEARRR